MGKYLFSGTYIGNGIRGVLRDGGTKRKKAIEQFVSSLGGTIDKVYFAFGGNDYLVICDLPDNITAAAGSLIVNSTGTVSGTVTVLLTPEELDRASKISAPFRPPGQ